MGRIAVSILAAMLCLLACAGLRAQPHEPPEFRDAFDAYIQGDYSGALPVLRELAERGHPPSQYLLALIYLTGSAVPRNEMAAAFWLHYAVIQDYPLAQYQLAVMLDEGLGIGEDAAIARTLLDHAALRGNASAQRRLKIMNAPLGTDRDESQAAERLHKEKDEEGAFLHRLRLARRGNVEAEYSVGLAYLFGEGALRNPDKALEWLRKAATAGNVRAQALLGTLLEHGEGVKHDLREALEWQRKAAQQGDQSAAEAARALSRKLEIR